MLQHRLVLWTYVFAYIEWYGCGKASNCCSMPVPIWIKVHNDSRLVHITCIYIFGYHSLIWLSDSSCLRSDDYMAALAKVHCLCRDWSISWEIPLLIFFDIIMRWYSSTETIFDSCFAVEMHAATPSNHVVFIAQWRMLADYIHLCIDTVVRSNVQLHVWFCSVEDACSNTHTLRRNAQRWLPGSIF